MKIDSTSIISIKKSRTTSSSYKVLGSTFQKLKNGTAVFDDMTFYGRPGTENISFRLESGGVNIDEVKKAYGLEYYEENSGIISISFRKCKKGERM